MTAQLSDRILLRASEVADFLNISERHWYELAARGLTPEPIRLGRSVRWRRAEIAEWIDAGSPSRDHWARMRGGDHDA